MLFPEGLEDSPFTIQNIVDQKLQISLNQVQIENQGLYYLIYKCHNYHDY